MKKKAIILFSIFIFLISILSIGVGLYFNFISKPSNILGIGIDNISNEFIKYTFMNDKIELGNTFDVSSSIDFNLDSEYYRKNDQEKYNFIKNISKMDTNLSIKQNINDKNFFLSLKQNISDEELLYKKIYVANSTKYYFVSGILNTYVNDGTCNYFETLNNENTNKDNIDYVYNFIIESLKNNIKNEYFKEYNNKTNIKGKEIDTHQISIEINDKLIKKILTGILDDLKNDEKSNFILSSIDSTFSKYKLNTDKKYLSKNEKYTINIYTTKFLYKPLKYEVIYLNEDDKRTYVYIDNEFSIIENDSVKYSGKVNYKDNGIYSIINDSYGNKIGELKLEKDNNNKMLDFTFDNGEEKIDIVYYSKYIDIEKDNGFTKENKLSFKHVVNKESRLNGDITLTSKVLKKVKIDEDISNSILDSKLSEEEKNKIKNKKDNLLSRLKRQ